MDQTIELTSAVVRVLTTALRDAGLTINGVSHNGREVIVHHVGTPSGADLTTAQGIVDAHDPVILTASRDGSTITVNISKPYNIDSATEVTLSVEGTPYPTATALTGTTGVQVLEAASTVRIGVETYPHEEVIV
jgi:hypothetical protein